MSSEPLAALVVDGGSEGRHRAVALAARLHHHLQVGLRVVSDLTLRCLCREGRTAALTPQPSPFLHFRPVPLAFGSISEDCHPYPSLSRGTTVTRESGSDPPYVSPFKSSHLANLDQGLMENALEVGCEGVPGLGWVG